MYDTELLQLYTRDSPPIIKDSRGKFLDDPTLYYNTYAATRRAFAQVSRSPITIVAWVI